MTDAAELLEEYFWDPEIKRLFRLNDDIDYGKQSSNVYEALYDDFMRSNVESVEFLLGRNLSVLIYNGQNDIIVETPGTIAMGGADPLRALALVSGTPC